MVTKKDSRGEADEACREKAAADVAAFVETLAGLPEAERMNRLNKRFETVAGCTRACADNFDPKKYLERNNEALPEVQLRALIGGNARGVATMAALCEEMEKSPLSRVNGTSYKFDQCVQRTVEEEQALKRNRKFLEGVSKNVAGHANRLGVAVMAMLLVSQDMLAA